MCLVDDFDRQPLLSRLEEIELLASIVHVNRELNLPELDRDGGFLKVHTLKEYLAGLGKPDDDANNTFTGRLLLLLESQPIFGDATYDKVLQECIAHYWRDFADHSDLFLPAFLINDILRFWRTLCVSYEVGGMDVPEKRRAKNFKLKFSRLLTCYSAIIALQVHFARFGTVSENDAIELIKLSPLKRLERSKLNCDQKYAHYFEDIVDMYDHFLEATHCSKEDLHEKMKDREYYKDSLENARQFGDAIYRLLMEMSEQDGSSGRTWRFFRYVAV